MSRYSSAMLSWAGSPRWSKLLKAEASVDEELARTYEGPTKDLRRTYEGPTNLFQSLAVHSCAKPSKFEEVQGPIGLALSILSGCLASKPQENQVITGKSCHGQCNKMQQASFPCGNTGRTVCIKLQFGHSRPAWELLRISCLNHIDLSIFIVIHLPWAIGVCFTCFQRHEDLPSSCLLALGKLHEASCW